MLHTSLQQLLIFITETCSIENSVRASEHLYIQLLSVDATLLQEQRQKALDNLSLVDPIIASDNFLSFSLCSLSLLAL